VLCNCLKEYPISVKKKKKLYYFGKKNLLMQHGETVSMLTNFLEHQNIRFRKKRFSKTHATNSSVWLPYRGLVPD